MRKEDLEKELKRCLGCKIKPCQKACPLGVSPHDFIKLAKEGDFRQAAAGIEDKNPMPRICGLVCPDLFCQRACIRAKIDSAIEIPHLQAEIIRRGGYNKIEKVQQNGLKAAVVGGGPAGLSAAFELMKAGWKVALYEKTGVLGGAMRLIPSYRLPKAIRDFEMKRLVDFPSIKVVLNTEIIDFSKLKKQYDGVILALGNIKPRVLGIVGEEYCVAYEKYLRAAPKYKGNKVAVLGGGEVALDCALTAKKNGAKVEMFVRRRREDMRIQKRDQEDLDKFGIEVHALSSVKEIKKKEKGYALSVIKNTLNDEGRAVAVAGSEYQLAGYDVIIQALGSYYPKENIPEGFIIAGDMGGNEGTVVEALASGKAAAQKLVNGGGK